MISEFQCGCSKCVHRIEAVKVPSKTSEMVPTGRDVNSFPAPWNQIESIIRKDIKCAQEGKSENIKEKEKDKIKYANLTWSLSLSLVNAAEQSTKAGAENIKTE